MVQLKRLRFCPATAEAKVGIILAKTYAAAMYGIEAARVPPAKVAKLTAAVIDVFKARNNNHNVDRFFASLSEEDRELDPMVQIFARRALQIRRSACKGEEAEVRFKASLMKYARRHAKGEEWPNWFYDTEAEEPKQSSSYPAGQPHPSTNEHTCDWDQDIDPMGPVGLLVESVVWNGLAIDKNFQLWQAGEEPVSILATPYQSLKGPAAHDGSQGEIQSRMGKKYEHQDGRSN